MFEALGLFRCCWPCRAHGPVTLMALLCLQDKADWVPHALLGAICQQMLDLCLLVKAQIWDQAESELQTCKRSIPEVADLTVRLLRVCGCPMLLLIGEHCSPSLRPCKLTGPS